MSFLLIYLFNQSFVYVSMVSWIFLAWKISWMEEPGRLQSMASQRVRHDWVTSLSLFTFMHWKRKQQPTPVFLPGESQGWEPGGLPSMGSHRVRHSWCDLAAANTFLISLSISLCVFFPRDYYSCFLLWATLPIHGACNLSFRSEVVHRRWKILECHWRQPMSLDEERALITNADPVTAPCS